MPEDKGLYRKPKDAFSPQPQGTNHLLVIGINQYVYFPRLYNAVKDGEDLIKTLTSLYHFEAKNVHRLYDQDASKDNIFDKLEYLVGKLENNDNLLLYFSGHGYLNEKSNIGYWIPVEAQKVSQYIPNSSVRDYILSIRSHHTLLIADACFSGSLFSHTNKDLEGRRYAEQIEKFPSRWALTSGRLEVVSDGQIGENSPFASYLLKYLNSIGIKQPFPVSDLVQYVTKATTHNARQMPRGGALQGVGDEGGEFVFYPRHSEESEWQQALQSDTSIAYTHYLKKYPEGKFAEEAKERKRQIDQAARKQIAQKAFDKAKTYNTLSDWEDFISLHDEFEDLIGMAKENIKAIETAEEEREKREREQQEAERQRLERERIAKEKAEKEQMEKERLEKQENALWQSAKDNDIIKSYQNYLDKFPNGRYAPDAKSRISQLEQIEQQKQEAERQRLERERIAKEKAEKEQMEKERLEKQENALWQSATDNDIIKSYQNYLDKFPNGRYAPDAKSRISQLEQIEQQKQEAEKERLERERIAKEKAEKEQMEKERLEKQENALWQSAKDNDIIKSYQNYLDKFPNGRYASDAKNRISQLEQIEQQKQEAEKERLERERIAKEKAEKERQWRMENALWQAAINNNQVLLYKQYLQEYPNGRYAEDAQSKIKELTRIQPPPGGESQKDKAQMQAIYKGLAAAAVLMIILWIWQPWKSQPQPSSTQETATEQNTSGTPEEVIEIPPDKTQEAAYADAMEKAKASIALEDFEQAKKYFEEALRQKPNDKEAQEQLEALQKLY